MLASVPCKHAALFNILRLTISCSSEPFPNKGPDSVCVLGVEATSYLQQIIDEPPSHEPLLAALGGDPIGLKEHIKTELNRWKDNNMRPLFVFDGLNVVGKDEIILAGANVALGKTNQAWELYGDNHPAEAVSAFGASGMFSYLNCVTSLILSRCCESVGIISYPSRSAH